MNSLSPEQKVFWDEYLSSLSQDRRPREPSIEASYAGDKNITDKLIYLYLSGKKTAGSSLFEDYLSKGDPLPKVGNYWIILDSAGRSKCIARTIRTEKHKFQDVPVEIAVAEGEGDLSLQHWRKVHTEFWSPHLQKWGLRHVDEATVITEFFEIVWWK